MPGAGERLPHHDPTPASAKAMALGRASTCLICSQPAPAPTVPPGLASLPPPPETRLSSQTSPRGLVNPLDHKEKDPRPFPTAPLLLSEGFKDPRFSCLSPGPLHQVAVGDRSMGRSLGGQEGWVLQLGCAEASQPGTAGCGQAGREGAPAAPGDLTLHGASSRPPVTWLLPAARGARHCMANDSWLRPRPQTPAPPRPLLFEKRIQKTLKKVHVS